MRIFDKCQICYKNKNFANYVSRRECTIYVIFWNKKKHHDVTTLSKIQSEKLLQLKLIVRESKSSHRESVNINKMNSLRFSLKSSIKMGALRCACVNE